MPQLSNPIVLPLFVDAIDRETKYFGDTNFQIANVLTECANNMDSDIALHCDNLNRIEIKEEPDDSYAQPMIHNKDRLNNCDTATNDGVLKNLAGSKPITTYLCHRCRQVFNSRDSFEMHYKTTYNETPVYTCHICEKQMKNKRSYQRHFNRHSSTQKFTCSFCSKKFSQDKLLKKHESVHNLTTSKSCSECNEEFFDLLKFKAHRRTHHTQTKKQQLYQCTDCGKIMKNRSSLSMHSKIHSNDRQYACMVCEQKFVQKINLINHLKVHNTTKTHSCNECGKSFVGQSQLLRHCTQHTNVRAFECEICKKFYKTKRDLKLHLMVHSVQRPHKCSMCSKTFLSTSKLKQHLNIHSGDRPFKCRHCPKDFTNFPNWLKHTRRRHKVDHKTGEKLMVMPNFLNKANKAGKVKTTKRTKAINAQDSNCDGIGTGSSAGTGTGIPSDDANPIASSTTMTIKMETIQTPNNGMDSTCNVSDNRLMNETIDDRETNAIDKCTMPFVVTKSGSDLSTITVNNRTLPLNTSDDLERAASLLMHQTLDLEDDFEFVSIKSESIDPIVTDGNDDLHTTDKSLTNNYNNTYSLPTDFPNIHYSNPCGSDFLYSYYPQATQCDFAMMPLPPINTVKRKLKGINSSSSIFPGMTNVL